MSVRGGYSVYQDIYEIIFSKTDFSGSGGMEKLYVAKPLEFVEHERGMPAKITASLERNDVQDLMEMLWHAGIRPKSGEGNAGQLGAMEKHLQDMRWLAFKGQLPR